MPLLLRAHALMPLILFYEYDNVCTRTTARCVYGVVASFCHDIERRRGICYHDIERPRGYRVATAWLLYTQAPRCKRKQGARKSRFCAPLLATYRVARKLY